MGANLSGEAGAHDSAVRAGRYDGPVRTARCPEIERGVGKAVLCREHSGSQRKRCNRPSSARGAGWIYRSRCLQLPRRESDAVRQNSLRSLQGFRVGDPRCQRDYRALCQSLCACEDGQGACRPHPRQSWKVQLRFARSGDACTSRGRTYAAVAKARPRACALQWCGTIGWISRRGTQPHRLHHHCVGRAYIKAGTLRALAVTSKTRSQVQPDVPTMTESGYPEIEGDNWVGILVPARTSKDIVNLLHREIVKIIGMSDMKERLTTLGFDLVASTPEEFDSRIRDEIEKWGHVIRAGHIKPQ